MFDSKEGLQMTEDAEKDLPVRFMAVFCQARCSYVHTQIVILVEGAVLRLTMPEHLHEMPVMGADQGASYLRVSVRAGLKMPHWLN